jgi:hypothetical protein
MAKYIIDFGKLRTFLNQESDKENKENEIVEAFERNEEGDLELTSKSQREVKSYGNKENGVMTYEIVKLLVERIIMSDAVSLDAFTFSEKIAFDTLVTLGIIIEKK